jgi:hypothetical protein
MRKPVYLAAMGISIVVAAVSLGVTLTRYLGLRGYSPKGTAQAAATVAGPNIPATPPSLWNNIFAPGDGMKMASRLSAANVKTASQAPRTNFVLVGTIVSSTPSARRAILWANGMKLPKAFREKEEVEPGTFLASIERDKVWITRGKEREKLEILPVGSRARPAAAESRPVSPDVPSLPGTVAPPPGPSLEWTQAVAVPQPSAGAGDDEEVSPRERRTRSRGIRR